MKKSKKKIAPVSTLLERELEIAIEPEMTKQVAIRELPVRLYAEFKSEASLQGVPIYKAFIDAMQMWISSHNQGR